MKRGGLIFLLASIFIFFNLTPVYSQDEDEFVLEEITVTATKRAENLQDVPLSVTATLGETFEKNGQSNLQEMLRDMPGVETRGGTTPAYFIRGVGDHAGGMAVESGVAISTNGVIGTVEGLTARGSVGYDVNRIEVTRGPDSTMQGRSAEGGTINIITNEPSHIFEGKGTVQGGNYDYFSTTGVINTPLGDKFALRAAFNSAERDGYLTNGVEFNNNGAGSGYLDNLSVRVRGMYEPNEKFKAILSAEYQRNIQKPGFAETGPIDLTKPFTTRMGPYWDPTEAPSIEDGKKRIYYADFSYDFGWASLYFQPTYLTRIWGALDWSRDFQVNTTDLIPDYWSYQERAMEQQQETYDLRLTSPDEGTFTWLAGIYKTRFEEWGDIAFGPRNATEMPPKQNLIVDKSRAMMRETKDIAFYISATYKFTDTLRVNFGGRYTKVDKIRNGSASATYYYPLDDGIPNSVTGERVYFATQDMTYTHDNFDYKVSLQKDLTTSSMVYALVSTAFKGGSFNNLPVDKSLYAPGYDDFCDEEYLTSYEIGSKNQLLDNRLRLNVSAFYYDYRDIGVNFEGNPFNETGGADPDYSSRLRDSAGDATQFGVEFESDFLMTPRDRLRLNVNYLKGEFTKINFTPLQHLENTEIPQMPEWRVNPSYQHRFDFSNGSQLLANIDGSYVSSCLYMIATSAYAPYNERDAYFKANASLAYYTKDGKWTISGYVRNMFNEVTYDTVTLPRVHIGTASLSFVPSDPRLFGVTLSAHFY